MSLVIVFVFKGLTFMPNFISVSFLSSVSCVFIRPDIPQRALRLFIHLLNYSVQPEERRDGEIFIKRRNKRSEYHRLTWSVALFCVRGTLGLLLFFMRSSAHSFIFLFFLRVWKHLRLNVYWTLKLFSLSGSIPHAVVTNGFVCKWNVCVW